MGAALACAAMSRPSTRKPRVEIPEGKLDEYVGRIYAQAKERAKNKSPCATPASLLHTSLDDTQLTAYFRKVLNDAKARSGKTWDGINATEVRCVSSCEVDTSCKTARSYGDLFQ